MVSLHAQHWNYSHAQRVQPSRMLSSYLSYHLNISYIGSPAQPLTHLREPSSTFLLNLGSPAQPYSTTNLGSPAQPYSTILGSPAQPYLTYLGSPAQPYSSSIIYREPSSTFQSHHLINHHFKLNSLSIKNIY